MHLFWTSWSELENKKSKQPRRLANTWRLNNMILKQQWIRGEMKREILKLNETNEATNTTDQNWWDTIKPVSKFISIHAYIQKLEKHQVNPLSLQESDKPDQQQQAIPTSWRKRNHQNRGGNKPKRHQDYSSSAQWIKELVLWENQQNTLPTSTTLQNKEGEDTHQ